MKNIHKPIPENTKIEVVMKKEATYGEYKKMIKQAKLKGWDIQGYQIGFYSDGLQNQLPK